MGLIGSGRGKREFWADDCGVSVFQQPGKFWHYLTSRRRNESMSILEVDENCYRLKVKNLSNNPR